MPTSDILSWLEAFPRKFTLVKALLFEKNCQYQLALGHFFTILRGFARDRRFSTKNAQKISKLVDKINALTLVAAQKLNVLPAEEEPQPGLVALVNFLEDLYFFLYRNNFWLGKSAWDAKKQILNLLLRLGLLDNVWHCLFVSAPRRVDVARESRLLSQPLPPDNALRVNRELTIWAVKNLKMKTGCYQGIIRNWKQELFGSKIDEARKGVIFGRFLRDLPGSFGEQQARVKIKVFSKCKHGFPVDYLRQFHLMSEKLEQNGMYDFINKEAAASSEQPLQLKKKLRCPLCKFPPKIFNLINSKILDSTSGASSPKTDGLLEDFKAVGGSAGNSRQVHEGRRGTQLHQEFPQENRRVRLHLRTSRVRRRCPRRSPRQQRGRPRA